MALNFELLNQGGPTNFFEGYSQGQEKMQANALAQQRAAQAQQEFGMRQQEFAAGQVEKKRLSTAAIVTQKTASAREAMLRAPTAADARRIVEMQYADPDLGPIRGRFGSLAQALAEVPDEPSAFQQYKEQEAMGMEAFLKQQAGNRAYNAAMGGAPDRAATPAAAATKPIAVPRYDATQPNLGAETFVSTADANPSRAGAATRYNPITDDFEIVPLRDQAAQGQFNALTRTYSPVVSSDIPPVAERLTKLNDRLADLTQNPPEKLTPQNREEIRNLKEEIIRITPTNAIAPQAPALVANAMIPQTPVAVAPVGELEKLIGQRNRLSGLSDQTPRVKANIDNLNKDIERLSKSKAEIVKVIGVATGTKNPVYLDVNTDEQYTYVTGTDGKQTRKLYSGGVDRSTSNVTATANARLPPLESAEQKGKGELNVNLYKVISDAARLATKTLPALETQAKILDSGFNTGFGTAAQKLVHQYCLHWVCQKLLNLLLTRKHFWLLLNKLFCKSNLSKKAHKPSPMQRELRIRGHNLAILLAPIVL